MHKFSYPYLRWDFWEGLRDFSHPLPPFFPTSVILHPMF